MWSDNGFLAIIGAHVPSRLRVMLAARRMSSDLRSYVLVDHVAKVG